MEKHELKPIKSLHDALEVRIIRNDCRLFMTNYTLEISPSQQQKWYTEIYKNENKKGNMTCFIFKYNNQNAGFGLIRKASGKYWITGGLMSSQRGKGLGIVLFQDIVKSTPSKEIWLEVLDTNPAAKKIYETLDFKKVKETEVKGKRVIIMKLEKAANDEKI